MFAMILMGFWCDFVISGSNSSWGPRTQDVLQQFQLATASLLETRGKTVYFNHLSTSIGAAQVERPLR